MTPVQLQNHNGWVAGPLRNKQIKSYAAMPEEARQRLRNFMDKYRGTAERNPKLYGDFIHSVFTRTILEQQLLMENAGVGGEELDPELGTLYRDISEFKDTEIPKAIDIIQSIARQINGELSAKRKNVGHTGVLDFRKTIRKGLDRSTVTASFRRDCCINRSYISAEVALWWAIRSVRRVNDRSA